jgi:hypothetical protein
VYLSTVLRWHSVHSNICCQWWGLINERQTAAERSLRFELRVRYVATRDCFVHLPSHIASQLLSEASPLPLVVLLKELPVTGNPAYSTAH